MFPIVGEIEGTIYIVLFWTTLYWLWVPFQGFLVFLPILLTSRARWLRAMVASDGTSSELPDAVPRGLMPSDFWSPSGILVLLIPCVVAPLLEVTWLLVLVPLWAPPVVAGRFWMRLRRRGVRQAHSVAWAALTAPTLVWTAYLVPRMGDFQWQARDWAGLEMYRYTDKAFSVEGSDLEGVVLVALVALAGAIIASRLSALRGFVDLLLLATVPVFVLALLSMPLGVIYAAWCFAVAGFWISRAGMESQGVSPILPIEKMGSSSHLPAGVAVAKHDRWDVLRQAGALAIGSAAVLALWSIFPADGGARAVGEWVCILSIGAYGYLRLRRVTGAEDAAGIAVLSQLSAIAAFVALSDTAFLISEGLPYIRADGGFYPGRLLADVANAIPIEPQLLGALVLAFATSLVLSGGTRRYGALLVGAAWPLVGSLAFKANELRLPEQTSVISWETSQVWGAAIGATVSLAAMWRVFGPRGQEVGVADASRTVAEKRAGIQGAEVGGGSES